MGNINCGNRARPVISSMNWFERRRLNHNQRIYNNLHPTNPVTSCCVIRGDRSPEYVEVPVDLIRIFEKNKKYNS